MLVKKIIHFFYMDVGFIYCYCLLEYLKSWHIILLHLCSCIHHTSTALIFVPFTSRYSITSAWTCKSNFFHFTSSLDQLSGVSAFSPLLGLLLQEELVPKEDQRGQSSCPGVGGGIPADILLLWIVRHPCTFSRNRVQCYVFILCGAG